MVGVATGAADSGVAIANAAAPKIKPVKREDILKLIMDLVWCGRTVRKLFIRATSKKLRLCNLSPVTGEQIRFTGPELVAFW